MISRTAIAALLTLGLAAAAGAAPQGQLIPPNLNPGLKTVPFVPTASAGAHMASTCEKQLVTRIDSATVIVGADGQVAHVTGMAAGIVGDAELKVTSIAADGLSATADFIACTSPSAESVTPVAASLPLSAAPRARSITVRTQGNSLTLQAH
jgi:hypothetical protein